MHKRKALPNIEIPIPPLVLTIPQVAEVLGVRPSKVYDLINKECLPALRVGKRGDRRVSVDALKRWIEQQEQAS